MVEEPPKIYRTAEAFYLDHLWSLCARGEDSTILVERKSLDVHALCNTAYLKKGNSYGIMLIIRIAVLGIYVKYMILLVVLKTLKNTFPSYVSLK